MNIAICDDNYSELGELEMMIYSFYNNNENLFMCNIFTSGEELMKFQESQKIFYQIYFLDIEMEEIDGLQVASYIRSYDLNALIVFTTRHTEFVFKAFDVNVFNYLIKPLEKKLVDNVLLKAEKFLNVRKTIFQFKSNKKLYTLNYDEIIYFENNMRKIVIHTNNNEYIYYDKFKNLSESMKNSLFIQVHSSYIINMDYVQRIANKEVLLKNNVILTISRNFYCDFMKKYKKFILERLE